MPSLICNVTFNPPVITMLGSSIKEETIHKLEHALPEVTTTAMCSQREPPKFVYVPNPPHWRMELGQHYCDQLGRAIIFLRLIEALNGEEWKLKGTNTVVSMDNGKDTNKFFFYRS
jgi:hypothetical protein